MVATKDLLLTAAKSADPTKAPHRLLAFSVADGKPAWTLDLPSPLVPDGLAVARGALYAVTVDGKVLAITPPTKGAR